MSDYEAQVARAMEAAKTLSSPRRFFEDIERQLDGKARQLYAAGKAGKVTPYDDLLRDEQQVWRERAERALEAEGRAHARRCGL